MTQQAAMMTAYARYRDESMRVEAQQTVEVALERELRARGMHETVWFCRDEQHDAIVELATDVAADLGLSRDSWWDYLIESATELCSNAPKK